VPTGGMTTRSPTRDTRPVHLRVEDYRRDLAELRSAMDARSRMDPTSAEFQAALLHEEKLLERIHTWSLANERDRPEAAPRGDTIA
jgi:hypothetical protein